MKASYTVEGAFIISGVILAVYAVICLAFTLYEEEVGYIQEAEMLEFDAVDYFRKISVVKSLAGKVYED